MRVDGYNHVVQVNRQPSVYRQGVVDMGAGGGSYRRLSLKLGSGCRG